MPPANSRATSPPPTESAPSSGTPPSYLSALRELESPVSSSVLNLAATLTTQAEDEADAENLRFLRSPVDPQDEWRAENARERLRRTSEERGDDRERRERLRRVMNRLSRIHDPPAYGDRIPTQQNLYDWSPANEADDEEELEQILQELRQQQPNTHPEILRVLGRSQLDAERESRNRAYSSRLLSSNQPSQTSESSLRSAAILQSVRRHPRFSARSRDYMQRYISDRDSAYRAIHDAESRDRLSPSRSVGANTSFSERSRYEASRQAWQAQQRTSERQNSMDRGLERGPERDSRARIDSYRRNYLENPSSSPSSTSPWLEQTIKYLSRLRYSNSYEDSLAYAVDAGFVTKEFFGDDYEDFILDTSALPPPAETSWLAPGAVLSGSQHATTVTSLVTPAATSSTILYRLRNNDTMTSTILDPGRPWLGHSYIPPHRRTGDAVTSQTPQQDRWPVKVTIHAVDYSTMSLSATMEAYDVPSHPHSFLGMTNTSLSSDSSNPPTTRTSSITTYLEGEILDFTNHTLLTESFKSTPMNDATYWRKLPPFHRYTDDELVRKLVSRRWMEELSQEWILMRWKERCFVKNARSSTAHSSAYSSHSSFTSTHSARTWPDTEERVAWRGAADSANDDEVAEDGCGLTISGFYYVCLRRSDGAVEGLYYDPQSSPYQHLKLLPEGGGSFPVWQFR